MARAATLDNGKLIDLNRTLGDEFQVLVFAAHWLMNTAESIEERGIDLNPHMLDSVGKMVLIIVGKIEERLRGIRDYHNRTEHGQAKE